MSGVGAVEQSWREKLDMLVVDDLQKDQEMKLRVIVELEKPLNEMNMNELEISGLESIEKLELISSVSDIIEKQSLVKLASLPYVKRIWKSVELKPLKKDSGTTTAEEGENP